MHFRDAIKAVTSVFGPHHGVIAQSMGAAAAVQAMIRETCFDRAVFIAPQARMSDYWSVFRASFGVPMDVWRRMQRGAERSLKIRFDDLNPADYAPRMTTPLLILHGLADRITPALQGKALAAAWPGAEYRPLDCGHLAILRDWRAVLVSLEFIKR